MSIQRIHSPRCGSYGWQARAYVPGERRRLTAFFADSEHGGTLAAHAKAWRRHAQLQREAKRLARRS